MTDIMRHEPVALPAPLANLPGSLAVITNETAARSLMQWASAISNAGILPKDLIGKPANIVIAVMHGLDLGLKPMQAINQVHVINGRPTLSAELMRALLEANDIEFEIDSSDEAATIRARRIGTERWKTATFTAEQAKKARLAGDNWQKYTEDMLVARATSRLCRRYFAGIIGGLMSTEEALDLPQNTRPTLEQVAQQREAPTVVADVTDAEVIDEQPPDPAQQQAELARLAEAHAARRAPRTPQEDAAVQKLDDEVTALDDGFDDDAWKAGAR